MESNIIQSILRNATRTDEEPLNILTINTHERYESNLCLTNCEFYALQLQNGPRWNTLYSKIPVNYHLIQEIPDWIDFDLILCQSKDHHKILRGLSDELNIPMIQLEHTFPMQAWDESTIRSMKSIQGHMNIFISNSSRKAWGWNENEAYVIRHGIDTDLFTPSNNHKKSEILSVCNEFVRRDWAVGYTLWSELIQNLPYRLVGSNPGLSEPAKSIEQLVCEYQQCQIFLNTTLASPIPMVLLEAMACGCAVVTTGTCMIPEIVENSLNGYISNDKKQLRHYLEYLLSHPTDCEKLGLEARKTILEKFSLDLFVEEWNRVFRVVANMEINKPI